MITPGRNYYGGTVRLTSRMYDADDNDVDPAMVECIVMSPGGTVTTYTFDVDDNLGRFNTGDYFCDVVPTETGKWHVRWVGTDPDYTVVDESAFQVDYSPVKEGLPLAASMSRYRPWR